MKEAGAEGAEADDEGGNEAGALGPLLRIPTQPLRITPLATLPYMIITHSLTTLQVQGFVEMTCALFEETEGEGPEAQATSVDLRQDSPPPRCWWASTPAVWNLLRVFCCSWALPEPQIRLLNHPVAFDPHGPESGWEDALKATMPFVFNADSTALERAKWQQQMASKIAADSSASRRGGETSGPPPTVLQDHQVSVKLGVYFIHACVVW